MEFIKKRLISNGLDLCLLIYIVFDFIMARSSPDMEGKGVDSTLFILFLVMLLLFKIGTQIWSSNKMLSVIISYVFLVVSFLLYLMQANVLFSIPLNIHLPIIGAGFFIIGASYLLKDSSKIRKNKHLWITLGIEGIYVLYMTYRSLYVVIVARQHEVFSDYLIFEKIIVILPLLVMIHMITLIWYKKSSEILFGALFLPISIFSFIGGFFISPVMHWEFFIFFSAFVFFSVGLLCMMYPLFKSTKTD